MKTRRETMLTSKQASKQAQHNCALFPCQEYNRIFFKGVFRPFYTDGVRLFVLPDKQYKFFSHRIYRLVNQNSRR